MHRASGIVGRDAELTEMDSFVARVGDGPTGIVLEGEAGVGKSALWLTGVELASGAGYRVLRCRPVAAEAKLSFAGLGDLLAHVFDDADRALPGAQQAALDGALLRGDAVVEDARAVGVALGGLLRLLSDDTPIIVAIDDVQWLDASTRRVVEFAVRRLESERLGFLVTRRVEPTDSRDEDALGLRGALGEKACRRVRIGPLSADAIATLLREQLIADVPLTTLIQIARASGGNPLYALEIGRGLPSAPLAPGEPIPVPENLLEGIRQHLGQVPEATREALLVLATLARPRASVLARALASPVLEAAFETGLIERDGDEVRFTHPLLASVAIGDASQGRRRDVHRQLADIVPDPEESARHLALAAEAEDPDAASALEAAAKIAKARGAPEAAAEMLALAATLTPADRPEERRRLTVAAARHLLDAGDMRGVRVLVEPLVTGLEAGPERAEVLGLLATGHFHSDNARAAVALAEQALAEAEGHPALALELRVTLALALAITGDGAGAVAHATVIRRLAGQFGVPQAAEAADAIELVMIDPLGIGRGEPDEPGLEPAHSSDEVPLPGGSATRAFVEGTRLFWQGDFDRARELLEPARADLHAAGDEGALPMVSHRLGLIEWWAGNWASARVLFEEAVALADATGRDAHRASAYAGVAVLDACEGREASVRAIVDEGLRFARATGAVAIAVPDLHWARGILELSLGRPEEAATDLTKGREAQRAMAIHHPLQLWFLADEVEALLAGGRVAEAESAVELFPVDGIAGELDWVRAARARARGLVAGAKGDFDEAMPEFEAALALQGASTVPFDRARTLLAAGRVHRRARQWGAARQSLTEALSCFDELGAPLWSGQARAELARIGGRPPSSLELSVSERRVADLAASGRTNKEVADELFMAVKTVEWHLGRVYRKLGIRNRAELSASLTATKEID